MSRIYWDSSALVAACLDGAIRQRLETTDGNVSRTHALAEVFSTLTGSRLGFRVDSDEAATLIAQLKARLEFVDLTTEQTTNALSQARSKGVRGGQVHDYLHAVAAVSGKCGTLLTLNEKDFRGLFDSLVVEKP